MSLPNVTSAKRLNDIRMNDEFPASSYDGNMLILFTGILDLSTICFFLEANMSV